MATTTDATPVRSRLRGGAAAAAARSVLTDGRFPSGGHAHSAGFEAATALGELDHPAELRRFLDGRLATTGTTDAWLVGAIAARIDDDTIDWDEADAEVQARIMSPTLRTVSRSLGRQWLRAGRRIWPDPLLDAVGRSGNESPHQVAAFTAVASIAGLAPIEAVAVHLHHLVSAVTTAAVRLHGLDPFVAQRHHLDALERWHPLVEAAAAAGVTPWRELPAPSGPMTDIAAERHAVTDGRLFQS